MRTIKFRVWDTKKKVMLLPEYIDYTALMIDMEGNQYKVRPGIVSDCVDSISRYELMQFTGVLDKNDKEVYEGDCRADGCYIGFNKLHLCYGWFMPNGGFKSEIIADTYDDKGKIKKEWSIDDEIVGSIFDNKELLNK
jgi:uncharacterized phage protein (TIGR01671 family)